MRAVAVQPDDRRIEVVERPEPTLSVRTQVLLRTLDVGICGTDCEIAAFEYGTVPDGEDWLVIGHESLTQVQEVGSDVRELAAGDLVVSTVRRPCRRPQCRPCRAGRHPFAEAPGLPLDPQGGIKHVVAVGAES